MKEEVAESVTAKAISSLSAKLDSLQKTVEDSRVVKEERPPPSDKRRRREETEKRSRRRRPASEEDHLTYVDDSGRQRDFETEEQR